MQKFLGLGSISNQKWTMMLLSNTKTFNWLVIAYPEGMFK